MRNTDSYRERVTMKKLIAFVTFITASGVSFAQTLPSAPSGTADPLTGIQDVGTYVLDLGMLVGAILLILTLVLAAISSMVGREVNTRLVGRAIGAGIALSGISFLADLILT